MPPTTLSKARATFKAVRKPPRRLPLPDSLDGSACGPFSDLLVKVRRLQGGSKPGLADVKLRALLRRGKATAGGPARRDSDELRIVCTPLPDGQQCRTPRVFRFTTAGPAGECGSVQSGGPDGVVRKSLGCGGLNVGGGHSTVAEGPTPPNTRIDMRVECDGTTCAVSGLTATDTGDAATCSAAGCPFGPYLPSAGNFVIDSASNLPGPAAVSLLGTFELRR